MKHIDPDSIGTHSLKIAHNFYEKYSLNLNELYTECDFTLDDFKKHNGSINIDVFLKSMDLVYQNLPLGIKMEDELSDHLKLSDIGFFGFTLMSSPNLEQCLELIINGFAIMNPSFKFQRLDFNNEKVLFVIKNDNFFKHHQETILNLVVLVFLDLLELFVEDFNQLKSSGEIKALPYDKDDERIIKFPKRILLNESKMKNVNFFEFQKKQIISEINRYNKEEGFVEKIKGMIKELVSNGVKPKIQMIADKLGVSSKTLSRKLAGYGTSFQVCVDSVIYQSALELIKQGLTTKEIAFSLGFNSIAGLNYVFQKKTGMTIMQYKEASLRLKKVVNS